jgi:hydroxymethylpyrimidine pyrophosphatase-like HAD family hydrolase
MPLIPQQELILEKFLDQVDFGAGSVILDLDGTALLEERGKIYMSGSVERGIEEVVKLGRPLILNTLRFPISVIWTVARELEAVIKGKIPCVLLNGSLLGYIEKKEDKFVFEELAAFPLRGEEIEGIIRGLTELVDNNIRDIIFFYYPRDWREGEIIWTPEADRIEFLENKYLSASRVRAWTLKELEEKMKLAEPCMAFLLVDRPGDTLMAYQHSRPSSFFTHEGIDKAFGMREMARRLQISLENSVGAGDTLMDNFLSELGLAVLVGNDRLPFRGVRETIILKDPIELGELITCFAALYEKRRNKSSNEN